MDGRNEDLIAILDREFRRREAKGDVYTSVTAQANFLGLDKSALSRLRAGERGMSAAKAHEIAKKLRGDLSDADQAALEAELLGTKPVPTGSELEIDQWFRARTKLGNLMFVEFRESPVLRPGRTTAPLLGSVAAAVAGGLDYGLIFPF